MHQESLRSFPEFSVSGFPTRTQKCISQGCSLIQRLKWGKIHCQAGVVALDFLRAVALGSHFLTSHCPKTACSSLPDCPLHRARLQKRVKEDVNKREVTVFHHLVLEVLSHYFAYSLNLSHYICLRGGVTQGMDTGRWESFRTILQAACHSCFTPFIFHHDLLRYVLLLSHFYEWRSRHRETVIYSRWHR